MGLNLTPLNLKANAFGHIIFSNVGSLNCDVPKAFSPLTPAAHNMMIACLGKVGKRAVVQGDDVIGVEDMVDCVFTFDQINMNSDIL